MSSLDSFNVSALKQVILTRPTTIKTSVSSEGPRSLKVSSFATVATAKNTSTKTGSKVIGKTTFMKVNEKLMWNVRYCKVPKMIYGHFFIGSLSTQKRNNKTTLILAVVASVVTFLIILVGIVWIRKIRWGENYTWLLQFSE